MTKSGSESIFQLTRLAAHVLTSPQSRVADLAAFVLAVILTQREKSEAARHHRIRSHLSTTVVWRVARAHTYHPRQKCVRKS